MSEPLPPKPDPLSPLDETVAVPPSNPTESPLMDSRPTDVTTDFDRDGSPSGSGPSSAAVRTNAAARSVQQSIADYRLDKKLGEGGMGRVYKALDSQGRAVAIKLLSQHLTCSDEALQRFKQEGYIASQINHPHCVFVHRVDEDRGIPYIAMELMTGRTLKDLVQSDGALPYKEAVRLILQCIDGLIEAHRRGMIHRDIKPANCYLDEHGNVKIGDFGLARSLVDDSELTRTGAFLGTPLFASPEQLLGQKIDERSDIYSLSATLYYLLAGRAPFESPNAAQVIAKIASSDPPPLAEAGAKVPEALEAIVMHGLARDRDKRFESFQKMRAALQPLLAPDREIASIPRRMVAGFLDWTIFNVLFPIGVVASTNLLAIDLMQLPDKVMYISTVVWFLYLWLFEWLCGWTIGKRMVRIKVVNKQNGMRQSAPKLLCRSGVFVMAFESVQLLSHALLDPAGKGGSLLATLCNYVVGLAVIFITWKKSNYRQMTHEWLSDTETCVAVPHRAGATAELELPEWKVPLAQEANYPQQLGRFVLRGKIRTADKEDWLLAHDVSLEREVWIHWWPVGALGVGVAGQAVNPSDSQASTSSAIHPYGAATKSMRVIESGVEQDRCWDAFLAPEGVLLSVLVKRGGRLPWSLANQLLSWFVTVSFAEQNHLPKDAWHAGRHWIDSIGRLTIAETPIEVDSDLCLNSPEAFGRQLALAALPQQHPLRRTMLEHSPSSRTCEVTELPSYSGLCLIERMASNRITLPEVKNVLARLSQTAEQVTPSMRFVHASAMTILAAHWFLMILLLVVMNAVMAVDVRYRRCQTLSAIRTIQQTPELFPSAFEGLSSEEKSEWLTVDKQNHVQEVLDARKQSLYTTFDHTFQFDKTILASVGMNDAAIHGDLRPEAVQRGETTAVKLSPDATVKLEGPVEIRVGGLMVRSRPLNGFLAGVATDQDVWSDWKRMPEMRESAWWTFVVAFCVVTVWSGLTRGGLSQFLTGVSIVRRDGRRMGMFRAGLRSALLALPFVVIPLTILALEDQGVEWLWLTFHMKLVLYFLPLFYLASSIIWPQIAPHDRVCNTVAVPR